MRRRLITVLLVAGLSMAAQELAVDAGQSTQKPATPGINWAQATPGFRFEFPRDHGSHPDFKLEWWYYTGNLDARDGRRFGYQLTFFRVGVEPRPANPSRWAIRDLFLAHFAVTDVSGRQFRFSDRVNRAGIGWAGAATETYRVWNDDWQAYRDGARHILRARTDEVAIALQLGEGDAPVLHGSGGVSRKGQSAGNASYYYSLPRMPTEGTVTIGGATFAVSGASWMDHEFGTTLLEAHQRGWNWFAVQLDDGTELMLYELTRDDGSRDPHSSGTLIDQDGRTGSLAATQFQLEPGRRWRSSASGGTYPTAWRIRVPQADLILDVSAVIDDQELRTDRSTGVTYWEGAIDITGSRAGRDVSGRGYLEMTGYVGNSLATVLH